MTRWETGSHDIEAMLTAGALEQVSPSPANATRLMAEAHRHLRSAELLAEDDPTGAYDMLYAGARKSMAAALATQGLRATSRGGHIAVQEAVTHQLGRSGAAIRPFGRLRRTRNDADYPRMDSPQLGPDDVAEDLPKARVIVAAMETLIPHLGPW